MISPVTPWPVVPTSADPAGVSSPAFQPTKAAAIPPHGEGTSAGSVVAHANPTVQFDAAAGVVVVQFRDDGGKVALSIPNQKQLNAYATDRAEGQRPSNNPLLA